MPAGTPSHVGREILGWAVARRGPLQAAPSRTERERPALRGFFCLATALWPRRSGARVPSLTPSVPSGAVISRGRDCCRADRGASLSSKGRGFCVALLSPLRYGFDCDARLGRDVLEVFMRRARATAPPSRRPTAHRLSAIGGQPTGTQGVAMKVGSIRWVFALGLVCLPTMTRADGFLFGRLTAPVTGDQLSAGAEAASISPDGRYVAFVSSSSNMGPPSNGSLERLSLRSGDRRVPARARRCSAPATATRRRSARTASRSRSSRTRTTWLPTVRPVSRTSSTARPTMPAGARSPSTPIWSARDWAGPRRTGLRRTPPSRETAATWRSCPPRPT